ncbi:extracellular solute-binding protein [Paenibacillus eucommiae]|uniref:Aldouronate transport system substrate-binding protein n=1 Tax=Paenibacillus eucommiae TaxID=1355755 RepID=A0ABS4IRK8_9BACL|nr:extracellular solute-binding protein [Paenibacillus eucommiae]MBP1990163.1 putative aldouronate transport system substrate-binding protein [Paenibacillus eucommiae]
MVKVKKSLVLIVCAIMLTAILAACSKNGNEKDNASNSETPSSTSPASEQASETPGKTALLPHAGEEIVYKAFGADLNMKEDPASPIFQEYQKMLGNVKIQWDMLPFSEYDNKVKLFLSSGDVPDLMWMRDSLKNSQTYGDSGMFLDFEKYKAYMPNLQAAIAKYPAINYLLNDKGQRFALPNVMGTDYAGEGFMYNKTLLDKLGVSVPTTVEEFYAAMLTIKEKDPSVIPFLTDGGGTPGADYTLYAIANMFGTGSNNGFTPSGGDFKFDKASGKWTFDAVSDPSYKDFLEFVSNMYNDKLLDPAIVSLSSDAAKAKLQQANWAFTYNYVSVIDGAYWPVTQGKEVPIEVEPMLAPAYKGKSNYFLTVIHDGAPYWGYFASAKVKNPEVLASILDKAYEPETMDLYNWGIEGVTYTNENGKKKFADDVISGKFDFNTQRFMLSRYVGISPPLYSNDWSLAQLPITKKIASFFLKALDEGKMQPTFAYPLPSLTTEQTDQFAKIMTPIRTYVKESELKFLTGKTKIADWDKYLEEMKKFGNIDEALEIINNGKNYDLGERIITKPDEVYGAE